jgi:hypothetical protein
MSMAPKKISFSHFLSGLGKDFLRVYQCRVSKLRRLNLLFDITAVRLTSV